MDVKERSLLLSSKWHEELTEDEKRDYNIEAEKVYDDFLK